MKEKESTRKLQKCGRKRDLRKLCVFPTEIWVRKLVIWSIGKKGEHRGSPYYNTITQRKKKYCA